MLGLLFIFSGEGLQQERQTNHYMAQTQQVGPGLQTSSLRKTTETLSRCSYALCMCTIFGESPAMASAWLSWIELSQEQRSFVSEKALQNYQSSLEFITFLCNISKDEGITIQQILDNLKSHTDSYNHFLCRSMSVVAASLLLSLPFYFIYLVYSPVSIDLNR